MRDAILSGMSLCLVLGACGGGASGGASTSTPATATPTPPTSSASYTTCGANDPKRVFFNDFETGSPFGADAHTQFEPGSSGPTRNDYAVLDGNLMGGRSGKVLRGNMWQYINGDSAQGQAFDPLAAGLGVTLRGSKSVSMPVRLKDIGILQVPSSDPLIPTTQRAKLYISLWLWFDNDFAYTARFDATTQGNQSVKLFYAFGPNDTRWVTSAHGAGYYQNFLNDNYQGGWLPYSATYFSGPKLEGSWRHMEFYFESESQPVFYQYGGNPSCGQGYRMEFPVVGANPASCLTDAEALAANSKDGIYMLRIDGQLVYDQHAMPFNARFSGITIPAWHGGGGQVIASAGWAMDDYCVRTEAPAAFFP